MDNKPFRGPQLSRAVQEYLKKYIIENGLRPGDALPPETALAQELGISRGSVREAIKSMETLGIVEVQHGNGLFVRGFNLDAVLDLLSHVLMFDRTRVPEFLQIRLWLELAAIDTIVDRIDGSTIDQLEAILARWESNVAQDAPWRQDHREFHRVLNGVAQNDALVALVDTFWILYNNIRLQVTVSDVDPSVHWQNHRKILDSVRAHDAALTRQCFLDSMGPLEDQLQRWDQAPAPVPSAVN